jgi:hypothetical protein
MRRPSRGSASNGRPTGHPTMPESRACETPRYVLQSPGLVENCVGLYVPLLEFNQGGPNADAGAKRISRRLPALPQFPRA